MGTGEIPREGLEAFGQRYDTPNEFASVGNIHQTWFVRGAMPVVMQRLNERVFSSPEDLMANMAIVGDAVRAAGLSTIEWLTAGQGGVLARDDHGGYWRAYHYLAGSVSELVTSGADAKAVAGAFGRYSGAVATIANSALIPVISSFHDIAAREREWRFAVLGDEANRFMQAQPEIERASRMLERIRALDEYDTWAQVPPRVAHNDAKPANLVRGEAGQMTVIDLDTTMTSTPLADVGELVRTVTRSVAEDLDTVAGSLQTERFGLLLRGWLQGYGHDLDDLERAALPVAGIMLSAENALRFLTDYLDGDKYFRVQRPDHNLARFRAQLVHTQVQLDGIGDLRRVAGNELRKAGR